jgi:hypothetical protein
LCPAPPGGFNFGVSRAGATSAAEALAAQTLFAALLAGGLGSDRTALSFMAVTLAARRNISQIRSIRSARVRRGLAMAGIVVSEARVSGGRAPCAIRHADAGTTGVPSSHPARRGRVP